MWNPNISFRRSGDNTYGVPWYHKRKIEVEPGEYDLPPPKMLITEEKMVNQLKGIHLSTDYTTHGTPGTSNAEVDMDESLGGLEGKSSSSLPTLVMCDEIRELQKSLESPLPQHIIDNFKRPSNALVLWRPPAGDLGKYLAAIRDGASGGKAGEQGPGAEAGSDVRMEDDDDNNNGSRNANMNGLFGRTV